MSNIVFHYQYRDGDNYKNAGKVIFSNPEKQTTAEINRLLEILFDDSVYFIASQIGVPEVFLYTDGDYSTNEADHCWHEFGCVDETNKPTTDTRTISEFISDVARARSEGWKEFEPLEREDEKSAWTLLGQFAKRTGWDEGAKLVLACRFIDSLDLGPKFREMLVERENQEDAACQESNSATTNT